MPLAPTARAWLLVAGDSAGGNLAAMVRLRAREARDPPIQGQLLFYPVTAHYDPPTPSYGEFAEGQAYADRLRDAGVACSHRCVGGMLHGFMAQTDLHPQARDAMCEACKWIRALQSGR